MASTWVKYQRKGGAAPEPVSRVTLRKEGFAFNAHFVGAADLEAMTHVVIFTDPPNYRVGFQFKDFKDHAAEEDSLAMANDGGGSKGKRGRCVQSTGLMRESPWLKAIAQIEDSRVRRYEPKWSGTDGMWVISIAPAFEIRVSDKSDVPSNVRGIYRYRRGDEIVYIGKGQIRSRLNSPDREEWDFEIVEYSVLPDENQQTKWESFWLDRFVEMNGKLPIFNRISGKRTLD
ncbi:MAG: hypothetical protein IPK22_02950 [Verrucomicrobiaceae bacterium]|nr:hypothetical protein [Verrucomicrobiaceae bacterium]